MQIKGLHTAFGYRLSGENRQDTGNALVTVTCLKGVFPCLFTAFPFCLILIKASVSQLVCFVSLKVALGSRFLRKGTSRQDTRYELFTANC
jgi:hypothetical protein